VRNVFRNLEKVVGGSVEILSLIVSSVALVLSAKATVWGLLTTHETWPSVTYGLSLLRYLAGIPRDLLWRTLTTSSALHQVDYGHLLWETGVFYFAATVLVAGLVAGFTAIEVFLSSLRGVLQLVGGVDIPFRGLRGRGTATGRGAAARTPLLEAREEG